MTGHRGEAMGFCLNDKFKSELVDAFSNTYRIALHAERIFTENIVVKAERQLEIAHLVAKHINENYYHRIPSLWIPHICVDAGELPTGEKFLAIEVVALHKAAFGLWN